MNRLWATSAAVVVMFLAPAVSKAATLSFSGVYQFDADVTLIPLILNSDSMITVQSYGYGGSTALVVNPGGFAGSLSLYDSTGAQVASDFVGGTAVGAGCSHAGNQDPVTGFCEDPSLAFSGIAGNYILVLSVQPNNGPAFLVDGFSLAAGTNFGAIPFVDPGDFTGQTIRTGNWYLQVDLDGSSPSEVPEPASLLLSAAGLTTLILLRRKK